MCLYLNDVSTFVWGFLSHINFQNIQEIRKGAVRGEGIEGEEGEMWKEWEKRGIEKNKTPGTFSDHGTSP